MRDMIVRPSMLFVHACAAWLSTLPHVAAMKGEPLPWHAVNCNARCNQELDEFDDDDLGMDMKEDEEQDAAMMEREEPDDFDETFKREVESRNAIPTLKELVERWRSRPILGVSPSCSVKAHYEAAGTRLADCMPMIPRPPKQMNPCDLWQPLPGRWNAWNKAARQADKLKGIASNKRRGRRWRA